MTLVFISLSSKNFRKGSMLFLGKLSERSHRVAASFLLH
jgi:hypothetical protein